MDCSKYIPEKCKADCCGPVPFEPEIFEKYKHLITKEYESQNILKELIRFKASHVVLPLTKDLTCVFLDESFKCLIYDERPDFCKMFGQNKHPRMKCPHRN